MVYLDFIIAAFIALVDVNSLLDFVYLPLTWFYVFLRGN